jgi:isopentenyl diphosphate isomerase/L-lactate dehydrogenase-like FMN-dependent dehydrogenase
VTDLQKSKLAAALNIEDLRILARRRLPKAVFDFIDGGAEDEWTLRQNRSQFERWGLVPRVLINVATRDTSVRIFGQTHGAPLVISPTGLAGLARARADLHLARAANAAGIPFTMSAAATVSIEELALNTTGPLWFQLYVLKDRELTKSLVYRAQASGYSALIVSVDCPVVGNRERDPRNGLTLPLRPRFDNCIDLARRLSWLWEMARFGVPLPANLVQDPGRRTTGEALTSWVHEQLDPTVSWDEIRWVRTHWKGPLMIKGITSPQDAKKAIDHGADGVVVSNQGGRQLDGAVPSLEALRRVADALGSRTTVLCDSGFRRGTDVVKALALGARAVLVGRATLWGVAAGGEPGAARALAILREEIDRTMALIGRPTIGDIDQTAVWDLGPSQSRPEELCYDDSTHRH